MAPHYGHRYSYGFGSGHRAPTINVYVNGNGNESGTARNSTTRNSANTPTARRPNPSSRAHDRNNDRTHNRARQTQRSRYRQQARLEVTPARGYQPPQPQRRHAGRAGQAINSSDPVTNARGSDRGSSPCTCQLGRNEPQRQRDVTVSNPARPHAREQATRVSPRTSTENAPATTNRALRRPSQPVNAPAKPQTPPPSPTRYRSLHPVRPATRREPIRMLNKPVPVRGQKATTSPAAAPAPAPASASASASASAGTKRPTNTYRGKDPIKRAVSNKKLQAIFRGCKLPGERKRPDRMDLRMGERKMMR